MRISRAALLPLLLAFSCSHAIADWHVASSEHFVVYANDSERDIRRFSERLERFHSALSLVFSTATTPPSPSSRVTIYVVGGERQVQRLYGENSQTVGAFYIPRAGGSLAVVPSVNTSRKGASYSEMALMHEYTHHFMYEHVPLLVPRWYSEGFAEYFSTVAFELSGSVNIGLAPPAVDPTYLTDIAIEELLDSKALAGNSSVRRQFSFYQRSWLLTHYLFSNEAGRGKVANYLASLNTGTPELQAATEVFGDLQALDAELDRYIRGELYYWQLPADRLTVAPIDIRDLSAGEAAIMPVVIRSKVGVNAQLAAETVVTAREIAAKFPDEPAVQAALAETEFDAGNDEAAIAAADRALAANPANMTALIQKANALTRLASATGSAKAWTEARKHVVAINRIEVDHPLPLMMYYQTFALQNTEPTQTAVQGLEWALELSPYDGEIRMLVAQRQIGEERFADAIYTIRPLAYNPHAGEDNPALKLLEVAENGLAAKLAAEQTAP